VPHFNALAGGDIPESIAMNDFIDPLKLDSSVYTDTTTWHCDTVVYPVIGVALAGILEGGRIARVEGGLLPNGVGYGRDVPSSAD